MYKYFSAILFFFLLLGVNVQSQTLTQNVRGNIVDKVSKTPLYGVTVRMQDNSAGTKTDDNGNFELKDIKIGRVSLVISYLGYNPIILNNLELNTANELILNLEMEEKVIQGKAVVVKAKKDKSKTINDMVTVSGRTFSIEETQRFAGGRNDVARMAQSFAGVQGSNDARNDIIVRGNSPVGVLYRLEGMDIPNPNHFAAAGTTGGPISMLNNNVLSNSDFLTSAFPAQYMNATSGIFDLNLRNGNNRNHEFLGQIGFNGIELNAEGPISRKNNSSFIVAYRYSTLGVFSALGINFGTGTAVPKYQDGSFKLKFSNKKGSTVLFGMGGLSNVKLWDSEGIGENLFGDNGEDLSYRTNTGIVGISRSYILSKKSFTKTTLAVRANSTTTLLDTFGADPITTKAPFYRDKSIQGAISLHAYYHSKLSRHTNIKTGFYVDRNFFRLSDSVFTAATNSFINLTDYRGALWTIKPYAQLQYKQTDKLTYTVGLSSIYFGFNNTFSLEPRLGMRYAPNPKQSFSLGYGLHSQIPPFRTYFEQIETSPNNYIRTNDELGLSKAHHIVLAYDRNLGKNTRIKVETYYQHLFNVPIDNQSNTFSLLNNGADFFVGTRDSMVNEGTGTNYGIELTLEKFMTKGFYYLVTASLYNSSYVPSDGQRYPTAFDGRYAANILGGREFFLNETRSKKGKVRQLSFTADFKTLVNGGRRYTPIDLDESIAQGEAIFDYTKTFAESYDPYFRIDVRIGFKMQSKKITQEWAFDIQNVTNRQNIFAVRFDNNSLSLKESYQTGFLPVMQYRIRF